LSRADLLASRAIAMALGAALAGLWACAAHDGAARSAASSATLPAEAAPASGTPLTPDPDRVATSVHVALGCFFELSIEGVAEADAGRLLAEATDEIDRVEDVLGGWRDDTDLARLNAQAASQPVAVPGLLFDAVSTALELGRATEGAFDVTVAPLVDAYGFRRGEARVPPPDELQRLAACVGASHLRLDPAARTIAFDRPGVAIDLDGLNKGIAVDRVIARLRAAGVTDAWISAGGSTIGSIGPPAPLPPRGVSITGPDGEAHARVELRDAVLSTSGNLRHVIVVDGHEYGAIFDPRTGRPVEADVISATAVAPRGDESEAYAKAAVVLGAEGAARLAAARDARFVLLLRDPAASGGIAVQRF